MSVHRSLKADRWGQPRRPRGQKPMFPERGAKLEGSPVARVAAAVKPAAIVSGLDTAGPKPPYLNRPSWHGRLPA